MPIPRMGLFQLCRQEGAKRRTDLVCSDALRFACLRTSKEWILLLLCMGTSYTAIPLVSILSL